MEHGFISCLPIIVLMIGALLTKRIMEMLQGGGAPEEGAPAEEGEPVYRNGGRLAYRRK